MTLFSRLMKMEIHDAISITSILTGGETRLSFNFVVWEQKFISYLGTYQLNLIKFHVINR